MTSILTRPKRALTYLIILIAAITLPVLAVAAMMVWQYTHHEIARLTKNLTDTNRKLNSELQELHNTDIATLRALATSPTIHEGDLGSFTLQARSFFDTHLPGASASIRAPNGELLIDTDRRTTNDGDSALYLMLIRDSSDRAVSDLLLGPSFAKSAYFITIPITSSGNIVSYLIARMPLARLVRLINRQNLGPDHFAIITDSNGRIMAREHDSEKSYGRVSLGFKDNLGKDSFHWSGLGSQGIRIEAAYETTMPSRWGTATGITRAALYQPLQLSLAWLSLMIGAALLIGLMTVGWLTGIFRQTLHGLSESATLLGIGNVMEPAHTPVLEANVISAAMNAAAVKLKQQSEELKEANARLERRVEQSGSELAAKSELLETTLAHMDQGLLVFDRGKHIELYNSRAAELSGVPETLLSRFPHVTEFIDYLIQNRAFDAVPTNLQILTSDSLKPGETIVNEKEKTDGTFIEIRTVPLSDGRIVRTYTDATSRKRTERRLEEIAQRDPLTGLPNRAAYRYHLEQLIESSRQSRACIGVIMVQITGLSEINAAHGFSHGDAVTEEIARKLNDTGGTFVARIKGSLFAILHTIPDRGGGVAELIGKLMRDLPGDYPVNGTKAAITFNAGISIFPAHGGTVDEIKHNARAALYRARDLGPNKCCIYEPDRQLAAAS